MNQKRSPLSAEEQEKAKILYASGKTIHAVAQNLGRSAHTLKKFLCKPEVVKEVSIQREELATMFDAITHRTLSGVTDEDIKKSSLLQKMTAAGISIDKALLLRNQATAIVDVRVLLDVAHMIRDQRDKEDEAQMQNWQQAHPAPAQIPASLVPAQTEHQPQTQPQLASRPVPTPTPSQKRAVEPTPQFKIRYTPVPLHAPDDNEDNSDPLMRGLSPTR